MGTGMSSGPQSPVRQQYPSDLTDAQWQLVEPFVRGNLDAGRLSWLFGREVVPAEEPFDPESYDAMLRIDLDKARASFPDVFAQYEDQDEEE